MMNNVLVSMLDSNPPNQWNLGLPLQLCIKTENKWKKLVQKQQNTPLKLPHLHIYCVSFILYKLTSLKVSGCLFSAFVLS